MNGQHYITREKACLKGAKEVVVHEIIFKETSRKRNSIERRQFNPFSSSLFFFISSHDVSTSSIYLRVRSHTPFLCLSFFKENVFAYFATPLENIFSNSKVPKHYHFCFVGEGDCYKCTNWWEDWERCFQLERPKETKETCPQLRYLLFWVWEKYELNIVVIVSLFDVSEN